jgi:large-conductance mechanosensitive channel
MEASGGRPMCSARRGREKEGCMIFVCIVVACIAFVVFIVVSGNNRKRKRQNAIAYTQTEEPKQGRAPGPD